MARRKKLKLKNRSKLSTTGVNSDRRKVLHKKKSKLAFYLQKGLSLDDARILAKIDNVDMGLIRSDPEFEEFIQRCSVAYERELVEYIEESASLGTWQAASWLLERKFPDKYGKTDRVKHEYTIKLQSFQKVVLDVINDADPALKRLVLQRLRGVNVKEVANDTRAIDYTDATDVIDADYAEVDM